MAIEWELYEQTQTRKAVRVTRENALDLAEHLQNSSVSFQSDGTVLLHTEFISVPEGDLVTNDGLHLSEGPWSPVGATETITPRYKAGDRVMVEGWNVNWDGPATVVRTFSYNSTFDVVVASDARGGREGRFPERYIRGYAFEDKVVGHGDFKVGDRVQEVADAWEDGTHCNPGKGSVTYLNDRFIEVTFDSAKGTEDKVYDCYDAWQLERVS